MLQTYLQKRLKKDNCSSKKANIRSFMRFEQFVFILHHLHLFPQPAYPQAFPVKPVLPYAAFPMKPLFFALPIPDNSKNICSSNLFHYNITMYKSTDKELSQGNN